MEQYGNTGKLIDRMQEFIGNGRALKWSFLAGSPGDKVEAFNRAWKEYFSGKMVPLATLLSTIPVASHLDHSRLTRTVTLAVERSWTVEHLLHVMPVFGVLAGIGVEIDLRPFGVVRQEVLDSGSSIHTKPADYTVLLWQIEDFVPELHESWGWSEVDAAIRIKQAVHDASSLLRHLSDGQSGSVICFDFGIDPLVALKGVLDSTHAQSPGNIRQAINVGLRDAVARIPLSKVHLLSLSNLQYKIGFKYWSDERLRMTAGCPVSGHGMISIFDEVIGVIAADVSKSRKVLLLDCDNTLWGGLLGEDGLDGIKLGGQYPGNVFAEIQKIIVQLYHQGVVIGLCSKNDEGRVRKCFDAHPGMILKPAQIAAWAVNWNAKSDNVRDVAARLNLGLDSIVFIDDSPLERQEVRRRCEGVFVPEVPANPMELYNFWIGFNPFPKVGLLPEDRIRSRSYVDDAKRAILRESAMSLPDFYRSLDMRARIWRAGASDAARISQMSMRTNQFNATTVRMNKADVQRILASPAHRIHLLGLSDSCGDSGVVACAVVRNEGLRMVVEQFMMSCRVLKRTVEQHFLGLIAQEYENKVKGMVLIYVPSGKNTMVSEFFATLGRSEETDAGLKWSLPVTHATISHLLQPWISPVRGEVEGR